MNREQYSSLSHSPRKVKRIDEKVENLSLGLRALRSVDQLITREKDRGKLLQGACKNLVEICGCNGAWIALIDESQTVVAVAEAGLGKAFLSLAEKLRCSELPACCQKALAQSEIVVMRGQPSTCANCSLVEKFCDGEAVTAPLEYSGKIYGLLVVSIPQNLDTGEENRALIKEVARDIAFALYGFKLNEEHMRAEKALHESEGHYSALIGSLADAVFEFKGGVLVWCNDKVEEIYGYTKDELIGKNASFFFPRDVNCLRFVQKISAAIKKRGVFRGTVTVRKKDGNLADIEYSISRTPTKDPIKVIVVARDVTERKRVEKERERLLVELAEKTKELEQIVYVSSHDLRSPLVNIQGFTKELEHAFEQLHEFLSSKSVPPVLKKKLAPILNEDIPIAFQYIVVSSAKMDSLLSGLLKLSRLGRAALNIQQLDMNRLISEVVASFEFQIKESGATVEVEDLPPCKGDETQVNQVFSNLLDNALKFLDPARPGVIRISGEEGKEQAVYCVEDNGIGIAKKDKELIFEIFRRLNHNAKPGEGLGLTIVRKILDRQGGRIWVKSEPGKGSRFFVSLHIKDIPIMEAPIIFGDQET